MRRFLGLVFASGMVLAACGVDGGSISSDAGPDFAVSVGEAPLFDGCESSGDISNYEWTIIEAPEGQPDSDGKPLRTEMFDCSFELENTMVLADVGDWTIELTVSNDDVEASDEVVVTVTE